MSDQIETSISRLLDALRTSAPGLLESAARAEYISAISSLAIGGAITVAVAIAATKAVRFAAKGRDDGPVVLAIAAVTAALLAGVLTMCSVPGFITCISAPDYCAIKSLVGGLN
jgi:hypothetical protein